MKILFFLLLIFSHINAFAFKFDDAEVNFDREEMESIDLLSERLSDFHKRNYEVLPESVKKEILIIKASKIFDMSDSSMRWANANLVKDRDTKLSNAFHNVVKWSDIHGDDLTSITWITFWEYVHKHDFQLALKISDCMISWREQNEPPVKLSPNGQGKIAWHWKLLSNRRKQGIIHVGIDLQKRTFICYESDIGAYFPEGDAIERIYSEIVQVPDMAGIHLGRGLIERQKN